MEIRKTLKSQKQKKENVLQDWAQHIKYPKSLSENRPIVDTGLFKSAAQLRYEKWLRLCIPLYKKNLRHRIFLLRMAKVRMQAAKRLRDKHILLWVRSRVIVFKEVKRLEQIAQQEAARQYQLDLEEQRKRQEAEFRKQKEEKDQEIRWIEEANERARIRKIEDARLEEERLERERLQREKINDLERQRIDMEKKQAALLEARRQEEQRLRQDRLLTLLRKEQLGLALYKKWLSQKKRMKAITDKHAYLLLQVLRIQRAYRKNLKKKRDIVVGTKVLNIQRLLAGALARLTIKRKLAAIPVLQRNLPMFVVRYRFRRFRNCIRKLQALFRMKKQGKIYQEQLKQKKQKATLLVIEQKKRMLLNRKLWKQAVLKIEMSRYAQLHRRECRLLRQYLAKLPYECRGLYFKFIDVKKHTHYLVNSFVNYMEKFHNLVPEQEGFELKYN